MGLTVPTSIDIIAGKTNNNNVRFCVDIKPNQVEKSRHIIIIKYRCSWVSSRCIISSKAQTNNNIISTQEHNIIFNPENKCVSIQLKCICWIIGILEWTSPVD
jgi:hypothetical protein